MSDMSLVSGCVAYVGYVPCVRFVWLCPLCTGCLICGLCPICHCCTVPALWYLCVRICHDPGAVPGSVRVCTGAGGACPGVSVFDAYVPCRQPGARRAGARGPWGTWGSRSCPGTAGTRRALKVRRALGPLCSGQTGPPSMLLHPPCSGGLWFVCGSGIYGDGLALVRAPTFLQLRGCLGGVGADGPR
jgi:hypothetical protein